MALSKECGICGGTFEAKRSLDKYCGRPCRDEARRRSQRITSHGVIDDNPELEDVLERTQQRDVERQNVAELRKLHAAENRMRRYLDVLDDRLEVYEPTPFVKPKKAKDHEVVPGHELVLITSDWHVGQKTTIEHTGGIYEQDMSTTRGQIFDMWNKIERLVTLGRASREYTKLHLMGLGDFVDNDDMRPSQHREVEDVVTVQTIQAFDLMSWLIKQCLTLVDEVEVDLIGGNHDRIGPRRGNAGLGELDYVDTWAWLMGAFVERLFVNEPRVKVRNWQTFFGFKEVAGHRFVFEHGSSFKWNANSYGGVPWYSVATLPDRYAKMLGAADFVAIGHGHRPALLPAGRGWMFVNGALPATSTYAQSSFKSVSRPMQTLVTIHPEHGLTSWEPLYLDVPGTVLPGEVWEDPEHYAALANTRR